ncbi:MAG: methionine--tRNA ligase [Patescibacteria group bacterium]|nr:MAG: methionine--tRNA ligase [Patescibacteria group bacterium]
MDKKKVLITTAIDYANDVIHIGHAYQKVLADCLSRFYRRTLGEDKVYFLTGTDEYGSSNQRAAEKRGITPKEHVDEISDKDKSELDSLDISYNRFIRTTDKDHNETAKRLFLKVFENGDIYKSSYTGLYCEGCEAYKTLTELDEDGRCLLHPTREIQKVEEENYFFRWSRYAEFLKDLLSEKNFVLPESRRKEMLSFVEQGINDLPVTRPKYKVSWGIEAPNDPDHVIYVWFDALINYFTAGNQNGFWDEHTRIIHLLGKDNARWHALLWPAMLKSAGEILPSTIYVHGFINLNGEKISKSKGNIIRPSELVSQFGSDVVRYYFLKHGPIVEDVDVSVDHIKQVYNSDLANGLGNTASRLARLAERSDLEFPILESTPSDEKFTEYLENFRVDLAIQHVWSKLSELDKHINDNEPWAIKDNNRLYEVLSWEINTLRNIISYLEPFIPKTAGKLGKAFGSEKISLKEQLFPRL